MTGRLGPVRTAVREVRRQPARFLPAVAVLALLAVLAFGLGALLDGIALGATGALRALPADLIVVADDAGSQLERSRLPADARAAVDAVDGVAASGVLAAVRLSVERPDGSADPAYVLTADHHPDAIPSRLGDGAAVDGALAGRGVHRGDRLTLDAAGTGVDVVATVGAVGLGLSGTVWVEPGRWRELVTRVRPDLVPPRAALIRPDLRAVPDAWPALTVRVADGRSPRRVARAIDAALGTTETLTVDEAVAAVPGTQRERHVFNGLIGVTLLVAWVVVALFVTLLTAERLPLLATLRALGISGRGLVAGIAMQAAMIAVVGVAAAVLLVIVAVPMLPPTVPVLLSAWRLVGVSVGLLAAAVLGAVGSVRPVLRLDPSSVIASPR